MYRLSRCSLLFRRSFKNRPKKLFCFSIGTLINYIPFVKDRQTDDLLKENMTIVKEADDLYNKGSYWDVYNLLNDKKYYSDGEILWRVCRVLYIISNDKSASTECSGEILNEAYKLISIAYLNKKDHAEINKWMGIILNKKCELEGRKMKLQYSGIVQAHLLRAHQLNPNDNVTLFMLGHFCYSFASLSWFQKKILNFVYGPVPETSYSEALGYFLKAEDAKPRSLLPNLYMLGKVYFAMGHYFRAKYYLSLVNGMDVTSKSEVVYKQEAHQLLKILQLFDITLFYLMDF